MARTAPSRIPAGIPVCDAHGTIVERVDAIRARRLALAPNATVVRKRLSGSRRKRGQQGEIVRILLTSDRDNEKMERSRRGDPRKYTFLDRSDEMPQGVHTLRHLPESTQELYFAVRTDCLRAA